MGEQYGVVLERGELVLSYQEGGFGIRYYELPLPVAPPSYAIILRRSLAEIEQRIGPEEFERLEYLSILSAFEQLAPNEIIAPDLIEVRQREQTITKRRLDTLVQATPVIAQVIDQAVADTERRSRRSLVV